MSSFLRSLLAGFIFITFLFPFVTSAQEYRKSPFGKKKPPQEKRQVVPNEYIIKLVAGNSSSKIKDLMPGFSILKIEELSDDTYRVVYEKDPGLENLVEAGKRSGIVIFAQPNRIYKAF
ncbi:hypothetical protein EHO59_03780 [Leptospira semungkisensis]|uniref:Uncharacterized protein n=1 Tax=Leptospira semungkisensis TaxID=2484985 RepID=A0A4R9G8P7_9LEPT|nr:hypothetical protein [Leptospira semungkisensis]TGK07237.1 hypothetical protein EHO59_03780 [Leptospira semungkisensis]